MLAMSKLQDDVYKVSLERTEEQRRFEKLSEKSKAALLKLNSLQRLVCLLSVHNAEYYTEDYSNTTIFLSMSKSVHLSHKLWIGYYLLYSVLQWDIEIYWVHKFKVVLDEAKIPCLLCEANLSAILVGYMAYHEVTSKVKVTYIRN